MKRFFKIISIVIAVILLSYLGYKMINNQPKTKDEIKTDSLFLATIKRNVILAGSINPRKEIELKANVSGILEKLYVEPGDFVEIGSKIAKIKLIPNAVTLNRAEADVTTKKIALEQAKIKLNRKQKLLEHKVISINEFENVKFDYDMKKQALKQAKVTYTITKEGAASMANVASNIVYATNNGTVLDIPKKEGASIIEANNFNNGTTIAEIANMNDLIFEGNVDEADVGKMKKGNIMQLSIGALPDKKFEAELEFIAPKGVDNQGTIRFNVRAKMKLNNQHNLRAGYSANATIVLESKENVLSIREKNIFYKEKKTYVKLKKEDNDFEDTEVKLGLSDGINVEILSGLSKDDIIKEI